MRNNTKDHARWAAETLDRYTAQHGGRRTAERQAILQAAYSMEQAFTVEELGKRLEADSFRVSRSTLYNTLGLFVRLGLLTKHHQGSPARYKSATMLGGSCHLVCDSCGKMTELALPKVTELLNGIKPRGFKKDRFEVYIYGLCNVCRKLKR